ncbi:hypothetical protein VPH35_092490 [Triticum aestivum]|uniref:protein NRT1/ PTR FAMILY 8.5 isoform X1 n=2 Tax=Triticum aestivum TaxID=4565 RepID=UPI0008439E8C|nr:protein NRT1/ PTR FAMILY 8.5-like isoform X1 [Triticum aestivum]
MGSSFGLVDFRGRPVDTRRHGGVRASMFIYRLHPLAIQAHVPSLHPPACIVNEPHNCEPVHGTNLSLLLLGMYMIYIGEGAIWACLPVLGGDQFDNADPVERRLESSFFNWYTFSVSMGSFFGLIFVVWLENNKGWCVGFAVCAAIVLLGLLIWAAGFPFYGNQVPTGSPITRIMQGYILLAIQSHVPSLHPPACIVNEPHNCEPVHDTNLSLLLLGMYMICVGEGAIRACLPALGGDQFDNADPVERRLESSFFNWYTFSVSMGSFFGLIFVVWLENNKGWGVGFAVCAAIVLLGLLIWAAGFPFYRNQVPAGSPITRIMQVIIVACKKRNLKLPANPDDDLNQMTDDDAKGLEVLQRTEGLQFLDKAAIKIENGARGPWSLCNVTQVEETKIACRMVPIFLTSAVGYMPVSIILNFTVQQGNTMDTRLGAIRVSPATLFVIPTVFQLVILVAYDRLLVPLLRRATGYVGGVTHPQRIGVGFVAAVPASAVAALVEARRKTVAEGSGLVDSPAGGVPMSVFWLTPQFFLLGVVDVTSFVCWLLIVARSKPPRS